MKVLILGVNGFIGHSLTARILSDTDWEVYGMDLGSDRIVASGTIGTAIALVLFGLAHDPATALGAPTS